MPANAALAGIFDDMAAMLELTGANPFRVNAFARAARVLRDYLESANEVSFTLRSIRIVNENHAYAEMARVYTVRGTSDERVETVFLGFRRVSGQWRIREVRVTP